MPVGCVLQLVLFRLDVSIRERLARCHIVGKVGVSEVLLWKETVPVPQKLARYSAARRAIQELFLNAKWPGQRRDPFQKFICQVCLPYGQSNNHYSPKNGSRRTCCAIHVPCTPLQVTG